jgi:mRNA-degrading endonuclease RelE of RelBE toxin-antitoxin system
MKRKFKVIVRKKFANDLVELSKSYPLIKKKVSELRTKIEIDPKSEPYKKLKKYSNLYRYRILDRIRIVVKFDGMKLTYLMADLRKKIYGRLSNLN